MMEMHGGGRVQLIGRTVFSQAMPGSDIVPAGRAPGGAPAFAALDLGTNNCRLMIATPAQGGFRVLDSFSRIVRLGEGLEESGALSETAMQRTIDALHACAHRLGRRQLRGVRAVATEACRRASNGRSFLSRVRDETGLAIDVISTREEAELALESCGALLHRNLPGEVGSRNRGLLFDIGGGSTEIAWVRLATADDGRAMQELIGYHSAPLGVLTLAERTGGDMFEPAGYEAMVEHVGAHLRAFEQVHCIAREVRRDTVRMLGTSGTVTTLASVTFGLPRYQRALVDGISLGGTAAREAIAQLRHSGRRGIAAHRCIGPDRAAYVLPGCAIFEAIHRLWPASSVTVADRGLRDGMLLRMMRTAAARHPGRGGTGRSRFGGDRAHSIVERQGQDPAGSREGSRYREGGV